VASENVYCPSCDEKVLNEETPEPVEVIEYMEKHCDSVLLDDPEPIGDLPNAVDFEFLRNEKAGERIKG